MRIANDVVVGLRYRILDEEGQVVDRTPEGEPWYYLHGAKECPAGLEAALEGQTEGARFEVTLPPEETYGVRHEEAVFQLERASLPSKQEPRAGMLLSIVSPKGETELRVVDVTETHITVDANHVLAGRTLRFEVEVASVRRATAQEILDGAARQTALVN